MLGNAPIIAFVSTVDAARAKAFYRDKLGLSFVSEDPFALVFDAHGIMLRVSIVREHSPAQQTVLGWHVTDIEATVTGLGKAGIKFQRYDGLKQDDRGIWTSPDGGRIAWFKDPDGNTLSITEFSARRS